MTKRNVDLIIRAKEDAAKAFNTVNAALEELAGIQKTVATGSEDMARALDKGEADAKDLAKAIASDVAGAAQKAETAFGRVSAAVDKARKNFAAQEGELAESEAAYRALKAQTDAAATAIENMRKKTGPFNDGFEKRLRAGEKQYGALIRQVERMAPAIARQQQGLEQSASNLIQVEGAAGAAAIALREFETGQRRISLGDGVQAQRELAASFRETNTASRVSVAAQQRLSTSFRVSEAAARRNAPSIRKVVQELLRLGPAADRAASGMRRGARGATNMRVAMAAFYGDSRKALSLMQRIRGEVLSLTAGFVGFYGVFRAGDSFLEAFQTIEAAQERLGAAFEQNTAQVGAEIAFLQAEADRLGFSFGILADSYSKFLISGKQAGIETEKLRKTFTQVTEASRVLKLSNEQINGVLTALSQIAGKGTLQMEELRQQLGDRLPGAVGLLANALGYGEDRLDEFYKAVENGNIDAESALVGLGQGLEDAYGAQLGSALDQTSAKIGRLQNLLFERKLTAANSGFIDGLEKAIDGLNAFLASEDGVALFESLGSAMGKILELIPGIVENFHLLVTAGEVFVSIKLAQVAAGLVGSIAKVGTASFGTRRAMVQMNRVIMASSPAFASAVVGAGRLGIALRGLRSVMFSMVAAGRALMVAVGGPIGILVTALSYFALESLGGVDDSVSVLNTTLARHKEMMSEIQAAYISAADGAETWKEKLEDVTEIELEAQLVRLRTQLREFQSSTENTLNTLKGSASEVRASMLSRGNDLGQQQLVRDLLDADAAFSRGEITATAYLDVIKRVGEEAPDMFPPALLESFVKVAREGGNIEKAIAEAEAALRLMNGTATDSDNVLLGLAEAADEGADALKRQEQAAAAFEEKLDALRKKVPGLAEEMKRLEEEEALKQLALEAAKLALESEGVAGAWERIAIALGNADAAAAGGGFMALIEGLSGAAGKFGEILANLGKAGSALYTGAVSGSAADKIIQVESGGDPNAKNPLSSATGLGQFIDSTWLSMFRKHFPEQAAGMAESAVLALRTDPDISRRMVELAVDGYAKFLGGRGIQPTDGNLYLSHFLGPAGAANLLQQDPNTPASEIFSSGTIAANKSVMGGDATAADIIAWANRKMGITEKELAVVSQINDLERERVDTAQDFQTSLRERLDGEQFELSVQGKALLDREVAKALHEAELEAQKAGVELTAAQRAEIEQITREKFKQQALDEAKAATDKDRNTQLEEARRLEEEVTRLKERRTFLKEQADYSEAQGDTAGMEEANNELAEVNDALDEAIAKAIAFWQAIGGEGSASAIQGLQQLQAELQRTESTALVTGEQINQMFADAAVKAFGKLAQKIAAGEATLADFGAAFLEMAADVLIQIGQMILKQAIFNAISGLTGGTNFGSSIAGLVNGLFHGGGIAGGTSQTRTTDPAIFANAARYHSGGIAGLRPDEVPAVLKEGEEVLTENDERHRRNGGGQAPQIKVVNAVDGTDALAQALSTSAGQQLILNYMREQRTEVKAALE